MFTFTEIQALIDICNDDKELKDAVINSVHPRDRSRLATVIHSRTAETFDRFDSDVCEQFLQFFVNLERGLTV